MSSPEIEQAYRERLLGDIARSEDVVRACFGDGDAEPIIASLRRTHGDDLHGRYRALTAQIETVNARSEAASKAAAAVPAAGPPIAAAPVEAVAEPPAKAQAPVTERKGGFAKVYTAVIDSLAPKMPDPVFRAYVYACRLADDTDGAFWVTHKTLGEKIGRRSRESGKRALKLLRQSGIIRRVTRGGPGRATTYQLVPVRQLDFGRAERVFEAWKTAERERNGRKLPGSATDPC